MADPAPLIGSQSSPTPAGVSAEWFKGVDGARLRAALFPAVGEEPARGSVVVSPGRTEPIEKYFEVVETLRARGFAVLVHDWRGQGLSHRMLGDRQLGHAVGYAAFLADYERLLATFGERLPRPWIALGHSMGGCLTLLALAEGESRFAAAILSAPMLGLLTGAIPARVARLLATASVVAGRSSAPFQKGQAGSSLFEGNILTHDAGRFGRNAELLEVCPDLALAGPTWGWLDFAFSAMAVLRRGAGVTRIASPVTIVAAGDDRLVDNLASRQIAARLPRGRFIQVDDAYHEILQETDTVQAVFWREFDTLAATIGVRG